VAPPPFPPDEVSPPVPPLAPDPPVESEVPPLPPELDVDDVLDMSPVADELVVELVELAALVDAVVLVPMPASGGGPIASSNSQAGPKTITPAKPARTNHPAPPTFRIPIPPRR
jgi:hypothetical protein